MAISFQTDQSGANINICSTSSHIFNFSLASNNTLTQATFVTKKGSGTTANIVVSVYDQPNGGGNLVSSSTVLASSISQSFASVVFSFADISLNSGTSYSLVISSSTSCSGNSPYSFKAGNFQVIDSGGTIINTGYGISSTINSISTITSTANQSMAISSNTSVVNSISIDPNYTASISGNIYCVSNVQSQATRSSNSSSKKVRLDGKGGQQQLVIYLGNKSPKIYHGNRVIIDKP